MTAVIKDEPSLDRTLDPQFLPHSHRTDMGRTTHLPSNFTVSRPLSAGNPSASVRRFPANCSPVVVGEAIFHAHLEQVMGLWIPRVQV